MLLVFLEGEVMNLSEYSKDVYESVILYDTMEEMTVEENNGFSTIELYDRRGKQIGHNGKI